MVSVPVRSAASLARVRAARKRHVAAVPAAVLVVHRPAAIKNDKVTIGLRDDERHIVALPVATEAPDSSNTAPHRTPLNP
jgi:pyridoxine 5'-phosphate synthase PdxJ